MRVRFLGSGAPDENAVCEAFGQSFPRGEWVDCDHPKILNNPAFEVDRFNGADPAAFDHDQNGDPGGSKPRRGRPRTKE